MEGQFIEVLSPSDFKRYLSPYITGGYKEDSSVLQEVLYKDDEIEGIVNMESYFVSENTDVFHLSVPVAMLWIFQLAIIYGCKDCNFESKEGEHYLREMNLTCKREITTTTFKCNLKLISKKDLGRQMFYKGRISIDDGSFVGTASFIMPKS